MTLRDYRIDTELNLQDALYSIALLDTQVITEFIVELAEHSLEFDGYRVLRDYFVGRLEDVS